jgi:exopolyphosphatase / guanosine-5'-triphosphate,3'-diphosphate pyrophosphatase
VRVALVDLGTNTCRLFLAHVAAAAGVCGAEAGGADPGGAPAADPGRAPDVDVVARVTTVVRLGQDVDRTGHLHVEAVSRTRGCLAGYVRAVAEFAPERRLLVATSVLRDAADGRTFLEGVFRDFALPSRVLTGREEADLSFRGGTAGLDPEEGPVVLVDIGGGSTEFAVGLPRAAPDVVRSLDVGVVRLTERFVRHDPPAPAELDELAAFVRAAIAGGVPASARAAARRMVGVAGTYTTLVAHKLGLREYRSELVHGHMLSLTDVDAAVALFSRLTNTQRGALAGIQKGREDVILAGALIAREACVAFDLDEVRVSEADILEGAARALAAGTLTPD